MTTFFNIALSFVATFFVGNYIIQNSTEPSHFRLIILVIIFIGLGYLMSLHVLTKKLLNLDVIADLKTRDSKFDINPTFICYFGFVSLFGIISHELYLFDNSIFDVSESYFNEGIHDFQWTIYAIDNMIRASFLDFLETYNIHISNITSTNNWYLTFVFLFKAMLSFFFVKALFNLAYYTWKMEHTFKSS